MRNKLDCCPSGKALKVFNGQDNFQTILSVIEVKEAHQSIPHRPRTGMVINVGVANVYRDASFQSEVVTQAILGERPEIVDQQGKWFRIKQWDGYEGWIYHFYLVKNPNYLNGSKRVRVNVPVTQIREKPATTAEPIRDAVFGVELPALSRKDVWVQVELPDGASGWLRKDPLVIKGTKREQLVQIAHGFLGTPYQWGGKTPKGFDCSGFIQTCFKAVGMVLPRDARQQHRFKDLPSIPAEKAKPGDLFFFSEAEDRITHVTMSLGGMEFIHSSGWVKVESLDAGNSRYNHQLKNIYVEGKDITRLIDTDE